MKTYTLYWTHQVVSVPIQFGLEHEVIITFYPNQVKGSHPLALSEDNIKLYFFPEIFDHISEWGLFQKTKKPQEIIKQVSAAGKLEETLCYMLNHGPNDYNDNDIVCPLEDEVYKQWKKIHGD